MKNKKFIGSVMIVLAALMWGLQYSFQSMAAVVGTFTVAFFKFSGGFLLLAIALIKKERFNKKTILGGMLIGVVIGCAIIFQQRGIELSSPANASFITALYIIFTPILGIFVGKKAGIRVCIAIPISLVGMYLLCVNGEFVLNKGDLILLAGAVLFALQIILIDKFIGDVDAIAFTSIQQITGAIISGTIVLFTEKPEMSDIINCLPQLLYLAIFAGATAEFIQNRYQRDVDPSLTSILMSLESVFGALFGWIILNQALSTKEIIGCVLMFIAMLIAE